LMPMAKVSPTGLTEIELIAGVVTVTSKDCVTPLSAAEIVVEPAASAASKPLTSIVATALVEDAQVTRLVMSRLVPSLYVPVAENCCVLFTGTDEVWGMIAIAVKLAPAAITVTFADP